MSIEANVTKSVSFRINAKFTDEATGDTIRAVGDKTSTRLSVKKASAWNAEGITIPNALFESLQELLEAIAEARKEAASE